MWTPTCHLGELGVATTPAVDTVIFEVAGLDVWAVKWKAVRGDDGFVAGIVKEVAGGIMPEVFDERVDVVFGLAGETDRDVGCDLLELLGLDVLEAFKNE